MHLISSGLASALVLINASRGLAGLFQFMVLVTTSATIIFYLAGAAASLKLAREGRIDWSAGFGAVAATGFVYALWALYGAGIEASAWSLAMTAAGLPVYLVMRRANKRAALPAASRG
jgi:basic amino acid/polyamine antiporter, APA family